MIFALRCPRLLVLGSFVLLGACEAPENPPRETQSASVEDGRIDCRIGSAQEFERFCLLEHQPGADGNILVIRKPDGGFRRLRITGDGRGVEAADGAEPATVKIIGDGLISVDLGGDTFRLPARVAP